jgi:serum/glucocorticoid-regulated kinase 2
MLVGFPPFYSNSMNRQELFERIKFAGPKYLPHLSSGSKQFMSDLLKKDPSKRLGANGAEEVKQHPWFTGVDWKCLENKGYDAPFRPVITSETDLKYFDTEFTEIEINSMSMSEGGAKQFKNYDGKKFLSLIFIFRFFLQRPESETVRGESEWRGEPL